MSSDVLIPVFLGLLIFFGFLALRLTDGDRRRAMTPADREADDALHDPEQWW